MSKIYVFAFEEYYPWGALNDLVGIVDNTDGDKTDETGKLRKEVLELVLAKASRPNYCEYVHVLHLDATGMPLRLDKLREESAYNKRFTIPDCEPVKGPDVSYVYELPGIAPEQPDPKTVPVYR